MSNKQTEYRKFKCEKCGAKYKSKILMLYCPSCKNSICIILNFSGIPEPEPDLKRQWLNALGPGWPCEVVDNRGYNYTLVYFHNILNGKIYFRRNKNYRSEITYDYYDFYPLGTPLDFAPSWAAYIEININGDFKFKEKFSASTDWIRWHNCPEGIKGTTLLIPEDWRIK